MTTRNSRIVLSLLIFGIASSLVFQARKAYRAGLEDYNRVALHANDGLLYQGRLEFFSGVPSYSSWETVHVSTTHFISDYYKTEAPKPLPLEISCAQDAKKRNTSCNFSFIYIEGKGRIAGDGSILVEQGTTRHELIKMAMRYLLRDRDAWERRARKAERELEAAKRANSPDTPTIPVGHVWKTVYRVCEVNLSSNSERPNCR